MIILISCKGSRTSWQDIVDSGGIEIGEPVQTITELFLPIKCDATGCTTITTKPKSFTSAPLYYTDYFLIIKNNKIGIILYKTLNEHGNNIDKIILPKTTIKGAYQVFYVDINNEQIYLRDININ
jgi:hypothetical protein